MSYQTTNPNGAKELLDAADGYLYVDVRTIEEFIEGHVPGAYNVPIAFRAPAGMQPNEAFLEVMRRHFPTDTKLVLGCKMGGRSMHACELLAQEGFTNLVNMHGGFHGAIDASGAVSEPGWAACGFSQEIGRASCRERV